MTDQWLLREGEVRHAWSVDGHRFRLARSGAAWGYRVGDTMYAARGGRLGWFVGDVLHEQGSGRATYILRSAAAPAFVGSTG